MSLEARPFLALDIDGTICKSSLLEAIINAALEEGLFPKSAFRDTFETKKRWGKRNTEGTYTAYLSKMVPAFMASMGGVEVSALDRVVDEVVSDQLNRRFLFPRKLIDTLKLSHQLIGISGSPEFAVKKYLEDLEIEPDFAYGSSYEISNGKYTGKAHSVGSKALILQTLVKREVVSWNGSVAIGDTISDKEMFQVVAGTGTPIMFNPSETLSDFGREFGWPRVLEVKDSTTVLRQDPTTGLYIEESQQNFLNSLRSAA